MEAAQLAQFEGLNGRLVELEQFGMADFEDLKVRFSLQQMDISDLKVLVRILTDGLSECGRKLERLSERRNPISESDQGEVGAVPVRGFKKKKGEDEQEEDMEEELTAWAAKVRVDRESHPTPVEKTEVFQTSGPSSGGTALPNPQVEEEVES